MATKKEIQMFIKYHSHDLQFIGKKYYCIPEHIYNAIMKGYKE